MKCQLCGFENEEGSGFCKNCNEPLFKQEISKDNPYSKKKKEEIEIEERIRAGAKFKAEKEVKQKEEKKQSTGCLFFIIIAIVIFVIYFLPAIKSDDDMRNRSALLTLSSEDILFQSGTGYYTTQCYATNNGDRAWKGSVMMTVKDDDGGYLYSSSSAAWPEMELKPGERDYLIAKIPMNEYLIKNAPQGVLVIVWSWGSREITKRVKIR